MDFGAHLASDSSLFFFLRLITVHGSLMIRHVCFLSVSLYAGDGKMRRFLPSNICITYDLPSPLSQEMRRKGSFVIYCTGRFGDYPTMLLFLPLKRTIQYSELYSGEIEAENHVAYLHRVCGQLPSIPSHSRSRMFLGPAIQF